MRVSFPHLIKRLWTTDPHECRKQLLMSKNNIFMLKHNQSTGALSLLNCSHCAFFFLFFAPPTEKNTHSQLVRDIYQLQGVATARFHTILFQWILSHCGISRNLSADHVAAHGRNNSARILLPYTCADADALVNRFGIDPTAQLCTYQE